MSDIISRSELTESIKRQYCTGCDNYNGSRCRACHADDMLSLVDDAADAPRWISVEERLPEEGQKVAFIPSCNHGSVYVGELSNIGKSGGVMFSHREGRSKSNYYAKYWMPLPEPPKEATS